MLGPLSSRDVAAFLARIVDLAPAPRAGLPELVAAWQALGLRPGDVVLLALTGGALLDHFFAALAAGYVPAPAPVGSPGRRLRDIVQLIDARAIASAHAPLDCDPQRVERFAAIEVAVFPPRAPPPTTPGEVVLFTSGTSGPASACVTTLPAILRNASRHADAVGQRQGDTVLVSMPLHTSFALVAQAAATLVRGGRLLLAALPFGPEAYLRALSDHDVRVSALVPSQARALLLRDAAWPTSLRVLSVGGDSLAVGHVAALLRGRPDRPLYLTYGLTQAGPRVATLAAHDEPSARHGTLGAPLAGTTLDLRDLGDGCSELLVASDTVMLRRFGRVEGRGDELLAPRLLATGDIFARDDAGALTYCGRRSEFIVRGGEKICVAAVRRLANALPGVVSARVRVFPAPDGQDFDLTLAVEGPREPPEHYRRLLTRELRLSELPRELAVVPPNALAPNPNPK